MATPESTTNAPSRAFRKIKVGGNLVDFTFLALPKELRDKIHDYTLSVGHAFHMLPTSERMAEGKLVCPFFNKDIGMPLLHTIRQIRHEATPHFWDHRTFLVALYGKRTGPQSVEPHFDPKSQNNWLQHLNWVFLDRIPRIQHLERNIGVFALYLLENLNYELLNSAEGDTAWMWSLWWPSSRPDRTTASQRQLNFTHAETFPLLKQLTYLKIRLTGVKTLTISSLGNEWQLGQRWVSSPAEESHGIIFLRYMINLKQDYQANFSTLPKLTEITYVTATASERFHRTGEYTWEIWYGKKDIGDFFQDG